MKSKDNNQMGKQVEKMANFKARMKKIANSLYVLIPSPICKAEEIDEREVVEINIEKIEQAVSGILSHYFFWVERFLEKNW